ncbi:MAG: hypothetical protein ACI9U2_003832 [Bradymonadia bacterium]|jgi:hypothetical protein
MRWIGLVCLALLWPACAVAELDPAGDGWADLSGWVAAGRATGIDLRTPANTVDFADIPAGSGIALIGDAAVADADALRRFVQEGGRAMIAVDADTADATLRTFDTGTAEATLQGERLGGHAALTILRPPNARVFANVGTLVCNHPLALRPIRDLDAAVRFADGAPFAFLLQLGEGELLLLGDASLFINLMLDAGGNRQFAANTLSWLSRAGQAEVTVIAGATSLTGTYGDARLDEGLDSINQALAGLAGTEAPSPLMLHLLLAVLLTIALGYALAVFPGRAARRPALTRPSAPAGRFERAAGNPGGPAAPEISTPDRPAESHT